MKEPEVRSKKRLILAVTGGVGTGKSTVAGLFKSSGVQVIDADRIAHKFLNPGTQVYKKITAVFGESILKKDTSIARAKLAGIVFNHNNLLKKFNNIIHPQVKKIIKEKINRSKAKIIVLDIPLLFETGMQDIADKIIVVKADKAKQIERLWNKRRFTKAQVLKRINAQMPLSSKVRSADFVIDNNGTLTNTNKQVERLRRMLWKN